MKDKSGIELIENLAHEIWNEHFVSIIGQAQVNYMLNKFQSPSAIAAQLNDGYEYYIISADQHKVGYFGLVLDENLSRMQISKIYIRN